MSMEQGGNSPGLHPLALSYNFANRTSEFLEARLFNRLHSDLGKYGILSFLDRHGDPAARWDTFINIMEPIQNNVVCMPDPNNPLDQAFVLGMDITDAEKRARFVRLHRLSMTGVPGDLLPDYDPMGDKYLALAGWGYPIVSTPGRIGTVLLKNQMREMYGSRLWRNERLYLANTLGALRANGVVRHLPPELQDHVERHYDTLPEDVANEIVLSSGRLSLLGRALRDFLVPGWRENPKLLKDLPLQYSHSNRPRIEEKTPFPRIRISDSVPMSGTNIARRVKGKATDRFRELADNKDDPETLFRVFELINEYRKEGLFALIGLGLNVVGALGYAAGGGVVEFGMRQQMRRQQRRLPPNQEDAA